MHELSICMSLVDQVLGIADRHGAASVSKIVLRIGPLSGIEADLLCNAYPLAADGTIAADAEIVIDEAEVVVCCSQCGSESRVAPNRLLCEACGDYRTRVVSGDDMILERLELGPVNRSAAGDRLRVPPGSAPRRAKSPG